MTTDLDTPQKIMNKKLAATINTYWEKHGVAANARVKLKRVPVHFKIVCRRRVALDKPSIARSYEIVSDLVGGGPNGWTQ